jgi:hypothetical protein
MKERIIYCLFISVLFISCKAQKPLRTGIVNYKDKAFKIYTSGVNASGKIIHYFGIQEKDGKYIDSLPPNAKPYYWLIPIEKNEVVFDEQRITEIVKEVLKDKLNKLHQQEEYLGIRFYFDKDGSIGMISMLAKNPTIISVKEIYQIQANLKKEIKATFKGNAWKDYGVIKRELPDIRF